MLWAGMTFSPALSHYAHGLDSSEAAIRSTLWLNAMTQVASTSVLTWGALWHVDLADLSQRSRAYVSLSVDKRFIPVLHCI